MEKVLIVKKLKKQKSFIDFLWYREAKVITIKVIILEVLRHVLAGNRTQPSRERGEHSSKKLFEQRVISYSEQLHISPRQWEFS